ncbi:hypothetical protein [Spirochaeta dissipatitropha]
MNKYIAIFTVLSFISGCSLYTDQGSRTTAVLTLRFQQEYSTELDISRSLMPDYDHEITVYRLFAEGPDFEQRYYEFEAGINEIELKTGFWVFSLQAENSQGQSIGRASGTAELYAGKHAELVLQLVPPDGIGLLQLQFVFDDDGSGLLPSALLSHMFDSYEIQLDFDVIEPGVFSVEHELNAGYYVLSAWFVDDASVEYGHCTYSLWIVSGMTTNVVLSYDPHFGIVREVLSIFIDAGRLQPLQVEIHSPLIRFPVNLPLLFEAWSDVEIDEDIMYRWYVNGIEQGSGVEFSFSAGLSPGYHRLDLLALGDSRGGSAFSLLEVLPEYTGVVLYNAELLPDKSSIGQNVDVSIRVSSAALGGASCEGLELHDSDSFLFTLDAEGNGYYSGQMSGIFDHPGSYPFFIYAFSGGEPVAELFAGSVKVPADPQNSMPAYPGSDMTADWNMEIGGGVSISSQDSFSGGQSLHFQRSFSGTGNTTVTIPLSGEKFNDPADAEVLSFWFKGQVLGSAPGLRFQLAGGGSSANYYDLNGIVEGYTYSLQQPSTGGVFSDLCISIQDWTRVELSLSDVNWSSPEGSKAEDYILKIRVRNSSEHDWYIDDIRFE